MSKEKTDEKEKSIGGIIRQMVAQGESFEKIRQTLIGLDVPKDQADVLVKLYQLRVSPSIASQIEKGLGKKFIYEEKAKKRKPIAREASLQRRRSYRLEDILKDISKISFPNPAKRAVMQKIVADYQEMLAREIEIKKELNRVLLEALDEKLSRHDHAKLRRSIDSLKEL